MRVSIDERLARLCGDFSVARVGEWLERKFASYDTSKADAISVVENKNDKEYFKSARVLGYVRELPAETAGGRDAMNRPLLVAAVEMRKILTERTSRQAQFNFAKRVLQNAVRGGAAGLNGYPSQGLFFFYDKDGFFRLSLVSGEMDGRKFKFNEAKRQSFFINPDRPNNIAKSRLSEPIESFADLKEAFSVETLTKEFYGKLFDWYEWAMKPKTGVTFPNELGDSGKDDQAYNAIALIRLITRLMFTWFLRQRDLVPSMLFDENALGEILRKTDLQSNDEDNYYRCILQNLFFATFNCDPRHRVRRFVKIFQGKSDPADKGITTLYRYENEFRDAKRFLEEMRKIPFLNCALFDCLDNVVYEDRKTGKRSVFCYDGFSREKTRRAHVPNALFFDAERGLVKLFDAYEFTVDENKADDADVALDPELLGKVFENLLGAYNEETRETARKATGSFYSPREIVDYMVMATLKNLIRTKLPSVKDEWLDMLFDARDERRELPFDDDVARAISDVLYSCKVLDPACGSGAFPMGILNCMVRVLCRLDPSNLILKKKVADIYFAEKGQLDPNLPKAVVDERRADIEYSFKTGQLHPEYMRKMLIIERCIYGVDIQPIAIQISKLRFFISLLCDQFREIRDDAQENRGILSLPQLEANFVCANTLISLPKVDDELKLTYDILEPKRLELAANRHEIFRARSVEKKEALKAKDKQIRDEIREAVYNLLAKPDADLIKAQEGVIAKLREEREQYETPKMIKVRRKKEAKVQHSLFDVLPDEPQGDQYEEVMVDENEPMREKIDRGIAQAEELIRREKAKAEKQHAARSADYADMVSGWDPYDQHATSKFFDPKWMFNIEDGFDIVIGNPPYVQLQANGGALAKLYQGCGYKTFTKTGDLYCLFTERGHDLVAKGGGVSYIMPNKWMIVEYGRALRKLFSENRLLQLLNFGDVQFFESATNYVVVFLIQKAEPLPSLLALSLNQKTYSGDFLEAVRQELTAYPTDVFTDESWVIIPRDRFNVLQKMCQKGKELKDWAIEIYRGILTGYNDAFYIDDKTRSALIKADHKSKELIKPLLRGRDITAYHTAPSGLWLLNVHNGMKAQGVKPVDVRKYPAVKAYLDQYLCELRKRGDKGDTPYNLRNCAYLDVFDKPKIIYPNMTTQFPFMYDESGVLANQKCFILSSGVDKRLLQYLTGILNSKISKFWIWYNLPELNGGAREISKVYFEHIPIPDADAKQQRQVSDLVDRILAAKKKDSDADTSALESQIDQLVYKLYGLTEEEIAVVEGRDGEKRNGGAGGADGVRALPRRRGGRVDATAAMGDDDEELE